MVASRIGHLNIIMKLILTHEQADFDALASLLGAHLIDQEAYAVLPRNINRNALKFIERHQAELGLTHYNDLPREQISHITLVDTQSLITFKGLHSETEISVIDHHPRKEGVNPEWQINISFTGACTTLIVEKIREQGIKLTSIQATMLLMGIYEDTGSLSYSTTTSRDLIAAAYLLEQEADLRTISDYLNPPLSNAQQQLYDRLMQGIESQRIENQTIITAKANGMDISDEISSVAHKMRDFLDPDALLLLVSTKQGVRLVARATTDALDVSKIASLFGGGGHARAASALIRPEGKLKPDDYEDLLNKTYQELLANLAKYVRPLLSVRHIMSKNPLILTPETAVDEVARLMQRYGFEGYPVVDNSRIVGLLNRRVVDRAISHKMSLTASSLMDAGDISVSPNDSLDHLQKLMASSGWGQIPVVDPQSGDIVGIVTRTDLIKTKSPQKLQPSQSNMAKRLKQAIPGARLALLHALAKEAERQNIPIYIVGGFVRDLLLNRPSLDFDIVTEGDAIYFVRNLVKNYGGRSISHNRFGTAKWYLADDLEKIAAKLSLEGLLDPNELPSHLDLITARTEFYEKPSALPTVESSSIKMDLHRRDFTINTLALRLDGDHFGKIFDYWGGLADLEDKKIRVLHALSFVDDPTRLLRAVRFEQRFGFNIEERTLALMQESLPLLHEITGSRLRHEIELIMAEPLAIKMMERLTYLGILEAIHHDLPWTTEIANDIEGTNVIEVPSNWSIPTQVEKLSLKQTLRIIYWLWGLDKDQINDVTSHLRINAKLVNLVYLSKSLKADVEGVCSMSPSQVYHRLENIPQLAIFAVYNSNVNDLAKDCLSQYVEKYSKVRPQSTGSTLRKRGLPPSEKYGEILGILRDAWLDGKISSFDEELALLDKLLS